MTETVTEMIGDEYKDWENGDIICISSPTGSGKTHFVLRTLLKYFAQKNQRILYLVNRKILKEQIKEDITYSGELFKYVDMIEIELYQTIEMQYRELCWKCEEERRRKTVYSRRLWDYDCVVCDECHYFLSDANFNTNTDLSYWWIRDVFENKIRIFMSATIDDIEQYIKEDWLHRKDAKTNYYKLPSTTSVFLRREGCIKRYPKNNQERTYDYIDIEIIEEGSIVNVVSNEESKWLIFVDSIKFGKTLKREIEIQLEANQYSKMGEKEEMIDIEKIEQKVILLKSKYDQDEESLSEVENLTAEKRFSAKVLISTSVMDNGITIKDTMMRNIVLIADTEVKFIQMLGRKRKDDERLHLYIVRQGQDQFERRRQAALRIHNIAKEYWNPFEENIQNPVKRRNHELSNVYRLNNLEIYLCTQQSKWFIDRIARNEIRLEDVFKVFRIEQGILFLSSLAFRNITNQICYYNDIIEKFKKEGKDAFVKEQLKWLGITGEGANSIINNSRLIEQERCRTIILEEIEKLFEDGKDSREMSKDESIEWKGTIRSEFKTLAESLEWKKGMPENENVFKDRKVHVINNLKRSNRHITDDFMEFFKMYDNFPYTVKVKGDTWTIMKDEKSDTEDKGSDKSK